jgi:hypothetical protein
MAHDYRGSRCELWRVACEVGRSASDLVHGIDQTLAIGRSEGPAGSAAGADATSCAAAETRVGCMLGLPQLKRRLRVVGIAAGVTRQLLWATA